MFKKHGHRNEKIYAVYCTMKQRCNNKNSDSFKNYGAKGVSVCEEWEDDFESFYEWAIKNGYRDNLTIDRINVEGNYEPSNCRWVDCITQANNKRNNKLIEYKGETHTIAEWAKIKGFSYYTLYERIVVHKWNLERAMTQKQRGI